ncbi:Protein of unknown function [Microbulbifer donghaiensis]|uniref:DUF3261 domain-containing protein n=1 Tax=Microbulbifer donghaiensis TaxID=494016 RepID=A0A1M5B1A9_9GAMM|nr:DUF3261 domain-containing protein [Microbulbifer donghaiensis]SHF36220.1 Protein of unknown function [Microbulbifer donghaiensis]
MFGRLSACLWLLLLAGCSTQPQSQPQLRPLAPLLDGEPRQLTQHIVVQYRGEQRDLIGASLLAPEQLQVSLLTPQGVSLLDIHYDGREVTAQQHLGRSRQIPPRALLADMQLVYWPLEMLQRSLPAPWQLRESRAENTRLRQLFLRGTLYTEVRYSTVDIWRADVQLEQKVLDYGLSIRNL